MSVTTRGTFTSLILQSESSLTTDELNISEYTATWKIRKDLALAAAPSIGDESAIHGGLYAISREISTEPGNVGVVRVKYRGAVNVLFGVVPPTKYSLNASGMDRPIQQHPDFKNASKFPVSEWVTEKKDIISAIGGSKTGEQEVFVGFKDTSDKRGIDSYIVGTARWTEERYSRTQPTESEIFQIGKRLAPTGFAGATPGHWLLTAVSFTQEGGFWVIRKEWTYSGPDLPWDPNIYGT